MRETGLEPVQISPADFKSAAATDYATLALTGPPDRIRTCNVPPSRANAGYKPGVLPLNYRRKNLNNLFQSVCCITSSERLRFNKRYYITSTFDITDCLLNNTRRTMHLIGIDIQMNFYMTVFKNIR